jgi:hexosaminidase
MLLITGLVVASVWPAPQLFRQGAHNLTLASDFAFLFNGSKTPSTLIDAFSRYSSLIRPHRSAQTAGNRLLHGMTVSVEDTDQAPPQQGTNESYSIRIFSGSSAILQAPTIYGAMRGLETFSQLVHYQFSTATYLIANVPLQIDDWPRFVHRGFMVDTSRHYQTLGMLKRLIDSMSFAKLNVLHWHAVDDQSFPLQVDAFPKLQGQGAYSAAERYSRLDVADIVEYSRLRGIRVMLEIDTPSHTACWCKGYGDSVCPPKPCADGITRTPLDPSTNRTFDMVQQVLQELSVQFPEELLHVGQDEVDVGCWSTEQNPTIGEWQQRHGFDETQGDQAYVYAANRIEDGVRSLKKRAVQWWPGLCLGVSTGNRSCGKPTGFCPCRGVVPSEGETDPTVRGLHPDTVLQLWSGPGRTDWNNTIAQVVSAGYSAIQSQGWYLEDIHLTTAWEAFYMNEPMEGITDPLAQARVLGGEAAMWGEYIDGSALLNTMWPRAAAAAERLWSPRHFNDTTEAKTRLANFRCLLLERGIPAATLDFVKSPYGLAQGGQAPPHPGSCYSQ